jgi:type I restriction enzyme R subunit
MPLTESTVEQAALDWLRSLDYQIIYGPGMAPGTPGAERDSYGQVVLESRLRQGLRRLNPELPNPALEDAFRKLARPGLPSLVVNNHHVHRFLAEGVPVEYQRPDGSIGGGLVKVLDIENPGNNEFLAVNQFTVVEDQNERRPDIVIFVNGLPLAVIELKNALSENATIATAYNQIQTYKKQIPSLFYYNEAVVVSDGIGARIGTITSNQEWFMPWRTIEGETLADKRLPQLQVVLRNLADLFSK